MALDAAAITSYVGGMALLAHGNTVGLARGFALTGGAGIELVGPLVHLAHDRPGRALASLALRALPTGIALLGFEVVRGECKTNDYAYGVACNDWSSVAPLGAVLAGLASLVDDTVLMREAPAAPLPSGNVTPVVSGGPISWIGVRGSF